MLNINEKHEILENEELVAVITAAVAASINRSTHDIIVKSFNIVKPITRTWNQIARVNQTTNWI